MKKRTAEQATIAGHPDCWTMANLHAALFVANVVLHPQGANAPTPSELWQQRQPITPTMRAAFTASLERRRQRTREEANIAENDLTRRILFDQLTVWLSVELSLSSILFVSPGGHLLHH